MYVVVAVAFCLSLCFFPPLKYKSILLLLHSIARSLSFLLRNKIIYSAKRGCFRLSCIYIKKNISIPSSMCGELKISRIFTYHKFCPPLSTRNVHGKIKIKKKKTRQYWKAFSLFFAALFSLFQFSLFSFLGSIISWIALVLECMEWK